MSTLTKDEIEFATEYIPAETNWPGGQEPGEPEPTESDLEKGWANLMSIEAKYEPRIGAHRVEVIGTAIGEAHADYARAGWPRVDIQKKLTESINDDDWGDE